MSRRSDKRSSSSSSSRRLSTLRRRSQSLQCTVSCGPLFELNLALSSFDRQRNEYCQRQRSERIPRSLRVHFWSAFFLESTRPLETRRNRGKPTEKKEVPLWRTTKKRKRVLVIKVTFLLFFFSNFDASKRAARAFPSSVSFHSKPVREAPLHALATHARRNRASDVGRKHQQPTRFFIGRRA